MPNLDNIRLWADALVSGEYVQTAGYLHGPEGWCCLGVACDVARKNGLELRSRVGITGRELFGADEDDLSLPSEVSQWLGLDTEDPELSGDHATYWNDVSEADFPSIAELIRREFELS